MADLDDFFAKKGKKKKGKSGKKSTNGTDGAEEKMAQLTTTTVEEETEWKEVRDTVEISADDLKLQTLSADEPTKDQGMDTKSSNKTKVSEEPKGKEQESSKANVSSPWQPVQKEKEPTSPATIVTKMPNVSSSGAYVPPSRRKPNTKMADPPDIHSESAFPSLVQTSDADKKKKSAAVDDEEEPQEQLYTDIHLQNKYSSLRTE